MGGVGADRDATPTALDHVAVFSTRPVADAQRRRLRMIAAIAAQGFALCNARAAPVESRVRGVGVGPRPVAPAEIVHEQPLEPLLPGLSLRESRHVCGSSSRFSVCRATS